MPKPTKGPRLGGGPAHERLLLANLAAALFTHRSIQTTETKAKRLRPYAEKLITSAKRGTLHSRREVMKVLRDKDVVHKLFAEIGPSFATRDGGYTRIVKTGPRRGDNAPMAIIELIDEETVTSAATRTTRRSATQRAGSTPVSAGSTPVSAGAAAVASAAGLQIEGDRDADAAAAPVAGEPVAAEPVATEPVAAEPAGDEATTVTDVSEPETPGQAGSAASSDPAEGAPEVDADPSTVTPDAPAGSSSQDPAEGAPETGDEADSKA